MALMSKLYGAHTAEPYLRITQTIVVGNSLVSLVGLHFLFLLRRFSCGSPGGDSMLGCWEIESSKLGV